MDISPPVWTSLAPGVLDALPLPLVVVDRSGLVLAVNHAWRQLAAQHGPSSGPVDRRPYLAVAPGQPAPGEPHALGEALQRVLDGSEQAVSIEQPIEGTGPARWYSVRVSRLEDAGGARALVVYDDITASRETALALRDAEVALERAQEIARVGSWRADFATGVFIASREGGRLLGWEPGPHTPEDLSDVIHPDDREYQASEWARAMQTGTYDVEHRVIVHGETRWMRVKAEVSFDEARRPVRALGVTMDVTEQHEAARALLHSQQELEQERAGLRTLLDTIPDYIWVKDTAGVFQLCNRAFEGLAGYPERDLIGRTDEDFFPPDVAARYREEDLRAIETGTPLALEQEVMPSTSVRHAWLETVKAPLYHGDRVVGVLGIARDVTLQHEMHAALAQSELQRQFALDAAQLGTWYRVPGGGGARLDARSQALMDLDATEVPGSEILARIHPDDRELVLETVRSAQTERRSVEFRVRHRDGSERWLLMHLHGASLGGTAADAADAPRSGTIQDVTERKHTEAKIARFVSANPVLIYALAVTSTGLSLRWVSDNIGSITGWSPEDATAPAWWTANIHPDDRARVDANNTLEAIGAHQIQEFRFRRPGGDYMWVRDEKRLVRDAAGAPVEIVGSWSDITQRVALEEQLRQSQKMEAIGLLAGGIAHDFNNLLTVISGNSELLAPLLPQGGSERHLLTEIRDAGERAGALTRQLLASSRSQVLSPRVMPLTRIVEGVRGMLVRLIGEDVRLDCRLAPDTGHVRVDPGQMEQVIVNLAVNARDAMPRGGHLILAASSMVIGEEYVRVHPDVAPGPYARLDVTDNGCGMAPEVQARIFEPFFTTKEAGKGTGLGLSTVFGIVKQSGGHIEVHSEPGLGTTFTILLPQVEAEVNLAPAEGRREPAASARGHETLLLVEDEESVRKLARMALERSGYTVLVAADGRAALDVAERHAGSLDLLVTDVVMPEMRGPDLADVLRERRPGLKVLFMSGYVQDPNDRTDVSGASFLHKPFSLKQLQEKVRGLLDDPS